MKHEPKDQFSDEKSGANLTILQAIAHAKETVSNMTGLPLDSVVHCGRSENLNWNVSLDVVESRARLGDNDLLSTYQIEIGAAGEVQTFSRTRRYHREDRDG